MPNPSNLILDDFGIFLKLYSWFHCYFASTTEWTASQTFVPAVRYLFRNGEKDLPYLYRLIIFQNGVKGSSTGQPEKYPHLPEDSSCPSSF